MNRFLYLVLFFCMSLLLLTACKSSVSDNEKSIPISEKEAQNDEKKTMAIDTLTSVVQWQGQLIGGAVQQGILRFSKGVFVVQQGRIVHGRFEINLKTLQVTNAYYQPISNAVGEQVMAFLTGEEYFDVEKHPTANFEITNHKGQNISGFLTINGLRRSERVEDVKIKEVDGKREISGVLSFNRLRFSIGDKHPVRNKLLADDIELNIVLRD